MFYEYNKRYIDKQSEIKSYTIKGFKNDNVLNSNTRGETRVERKQYDGYKGFFF